MVTGVRQDPFAKAHPIVPVVDKIPSEVGTYLNPELYGQPKEKELGYQKRTEPATPTPVEKPRLNELPKLSLPIKQD
jgi:hypothetical protein